MTNQIIEVPDISVVKTTGSTKQLFSLRDQKVKKETLQNFGTGSGVKYNDDLYVLDGGIIPIVRMTTGKINPSFTIEKVGDIEVDWGDGTLELNLFFHTYTDGAASHDVVFYGYNTVLISLTCDSNQLSQLDVTMNIALTSLFCVSNQITQLDISKNLLLVNINCGHNLLAQLDSSKCIYLTHLLCTSNQLITLDITYNTALTYLACGGNNLTMLDVSKNTALTTIHCDNNQLTQLDISKNIDLLLFYCDHNQLTLLETSQNINLLYLFCYNNQLIQLDFSQNISLNNILCSNNPLILDNQMLILLANSLRRRSGTSGNLYINNPTSAQWIQSICDAKNWIIE